MCGIRTTLAALSCSDFVRPPSCLSLWHAPSSLHAVCRTEPSGIRNAQARTGTVMELLNAWHVRRREQQRRDREAETERVLVRNQELNARCAPLLLCTRYTLAPLHVQLVRATLSSLAGRAAFVYHVFSGERRRSGLWRRRGCSSRKSSAKRTTRLLLSFALRVNAAVPPPLPSFPPHSCMHEHAHACARKPHAQQTTRQTDRSTHYTHRRAQ